MGMDDFNKFLWLNLDTNDIVSANEMVSIMKDADKKLKNKGLWVEVYCTCTETDLEDVGIGEYEFWGSRGYDNRKETIPTDYELEVTGGEILGIIPTEEEELKLESFSADDLTDEQYKSLVEYAIEF